jgi:hypothetical protein
VSALLCIGVPTFERADDLERLLACLERQLSDAGEDITVFVSDNASADRTPELLREAAERLPWLRVHRQPTNLGAPPNIQWLINHAGDSEYLWLIGDDDVPHDGALATVVGLLRGQRPAWLHLPHRWVAPSGRVVGASPARGHVERYASAADMYRAHHHWLTFMSASIVRTRDLQESIREVDTDNAYIPLLWFFRAGLDGPCVVAAEHLLDGGTEITWADRRHTIMTLDFTALYDDGLHAGLSEAEFGASLDGFYVDGWAFDLWERLPIERLAEAVVRFPQSEGLRDYLWRLARAQGRRDLLAVLDDAAHAVGDDRIARELVAAGEAAFAAGDAHAAAQRFAEAAARLPGLTVAWNDLAVTAHHLGLPDARAYVEHALFVAPHDRDALLNRGAIRLADGDRLGAQADAASVIERDPEDAEARQLLTLAGGPGP